MHTSITRLGLKLFNFLLLFLAIACGCLVTMPHENILAAEDDVPASAILQDLKSFREMGTVLHVAAHPDDENTQLLTFLARGRGCRTAYLSLTRGDGGQNVLGSEFGEELGVIRTQELLAARRLDGAQQFFTRAKDFGFSKDYLQTLTKWDKQQVLSDIVRVIRSFRPDVIVTRFSPVPGGTHGHHTASAFLALEAFKIAGDPKEFPEQLRDSGLSAWQPKRIVVNGGGFGGGGGNKAGGLRLDIGGTDPVLGMSFGEISGRSRAMHKSQGFGNFGGGGGKGGGGKTESFSLLRGEPATKDIFEGVDTTWNRVRGAALIGKEMAELIDKAIGQFDPKNPAASVPAILEMRKLLEIRDGNRALASGDDILVNDKRRQLDRILQACLGLEVKTEVDHAELVADETFKLKRTVVIKHAAGVDRAGWSFPRDATTTMASFGAESGPDATGKVIWVETTNTKLPSTTPLSQPYWLRKEGTAGMFRVDDPSLIGQPENPPVFPVQHIFMVGGQKLVIQDEPVQIIKDAKKGEIRRRLEVIGPVAVSFAGTVKLFGPGATKSVEVDVVAFRPGVSGTLQLDAPKGWKVEPKVQSFTLAKIGDRSQLPFKVSAPPNGATGVVTASATVGGAQFASRRVEINYNHLPPILLQPTAKLKAMGIDVAIRGKKVGYVPGAGDSVAGCLEEMGYEVTSLTGADLVPERLRGFDAVVVGIRAFNVRNDIAKAMPALFDFVKNGGNMIVQYQKVGYKVDKLAPYELTISGNNFDRVTDENSDMKFLAPDHPAMTMPNKITSDDFKGWVQERGIYFPTKWDEHFVPLFSCNDPGAAPLKGGVLVAQYGQGYFVYSSFSWFRQLPEGVPGAYRLFANLVSLGKK